MVTFLSPFFLGFSFLEAVRFASLASESPSAPSWYYLFRPPNHPSPVNSCQESHVSIMSRIFISFLFSLPRRRMFDAIFQILRDSKSLELAMACCRLLNELDQVFFFLHFFFFFDCNDAKMMNPKSLLLFCIALPKNLFNGSR